MYIFHCIQFEYLQVYKYITHPFLIIFSNTRGVTLKQLLMNHIITLVIDSAEHPLPQFTHSALKTNR